MIDWPDGPSAVRLRLCRAWLPPDAEEPAARRGAGAAGPATAPSLAGRCAAAAPAPEALDAVWLPAEQPAASRQVPAVRAPAQAANVRRAGEMVLGGASAVMPMGRRPCGPGSAQIVTTWHRCYLACPGRGACRPGR